MTAEAGAVESVYSDFCGMGYSWIIFIHLLVHELAAIFLISHIPVIGSPWDYKITLGFYNPEGFRG